MVGIKKHELIIDLMLKKAYYIYESVENWLLYNDNLYISNIKPLLIDKNKIRLNWIEKKIEVGNIGEMPMLARNCKGSSFISQPSQGIKERRTKSERHLFDDTCVA